MAADTHKEQSTKDLLIQTFWHLLEEKPYSKITVNEIASTAGVNRNTFYYHFQDIPDLFEKTIEYWANEILEKALETGVHTGPELTALIVKTSRERKAAIYNIYNSVQREAFQAQLNRIVGYVSNQYVDSAFEGVTVRDEDVRIIKKYNKCLIIGITYDWLDSGMSYDLVSDAERIAVLFYGSVENAVISRTQSETASE